MEPQKWDLGPETLKSETWDLQFSIVLIVYYTLDTLHLLKISKYCKQLGPLSSYLNFSKILGKKYCERVSIYLVKLKIVSLQLHKCNHF